jgi:hypothetical protein
MKTAFVPEISAEIPPAPADGRTAAKDVPGTKGRLTSVAVQYKIIGDAPTANVKVWGFD